MSLENFKGFQKKTKIDFSPGINLIYGKNSAGKSSIIQAIRLLKQSLSIKGSPCNFHMVVPSYMRIAGSLTFQEGFLGIINKKDLSKDLTIGIGSYGRGYISKERRKFRRERFGEHIFSNKNNKKFPDIKQINIDKKEVIEDSNSLKNKATFLNLVFKKKQKFKKDKLAKLLTLSLRSRSRGEGIDVDRLLKAYKNKAPNLLEEDLYFQFLDVKNSKFKFGRHDEAYNKIMDDLNKYRKIINKNIDFGLSEQIGLSGSQISLLLKKGKDKKLRDKYFNAGEFSLIKHNELKSLRNFVNSKNFTNKEKFISFLYKDYKKN